MHLLPILSLALLAAQTVVVAAQLSFEELQAQARSAHARGNREDAIRCLTQAIALEPKSARGYLLRAGFYDAIREPAKAVADYDQALLLDPKLPAAWQGRGSAHFKLGHIAESIADFDKFLELSPGQSPHHWQRGISLYYAGRFDEGRKQFELHQTVNSNDVENAVWHYLCIARTNGVETARATLIPIKGDTRVPMMEVHALFAGKLKPEDVLKAAGADDPPPALRNRQLFYAHLYVGLFFEATGDDPNARNHITQAATLAAAGDYMSDVARVHVQLRWPKATSSPRAKSSR